MKIKMKKIFALSLFLACTLQATWATEYDFSAVVPSGQTLYFHKLSSNTVEIVYPSDYNTNPYYNAVEPTGDLVIPPTVSYGGNTYQITALGQYAFSDCDGLTSLVIPSTVTMLDVCSISKTGITSITIPSSVTTIANSVFLYSTNLQSVTIDNAAASIGNQVFRGCSNLRSVDLGNSITSIGYAAFGECGSLSNLTVPNSVTTISENGAFSSNTIVHYCGNLEGAPWGARYAGCTYEENDFLYEDDTKTTLLLYTGTSSNVTIPNSVTSIYIYAFDGCSTLTNVTIPNSVISIGNYAFRNCENLTSVTIPNSVTSIGKYAFYNCENLTSVTIPNSVTSIGSSTFENCENLTSVTIPNSVTSIGSYAFGYCENLTSVTIGTSVTTFERNNAFSSCNNLKTVYNLSALNITKGANTYGYVAKNAKRVVKCTEHSGSGDNIIYKIPTTFTIVDNDASTSEFEIPSSTIPTNFIYKEGSVWKAKNIVLTDGQDTFAAPETFTAETATYTREFTNSNRSTLYLPFTAAIPANFEVYDFTSFANNTISFTKREDSIYAYTPYLVGYDLSKDGNTTTCTITKTNAVFPKSESANYHPVTHDDMTFSGVISRTQMTSTNNYGYSNGFFVQSGGSAHVNPFRSYFTYTPSGNAPQSLPPTLNVEVGYGDPVGIDAVETPEQEYDGRYGKDVYDMLGRLVRKNADNLEGLPQGIYIWKGKKFMNYDL